MCKQKTTVVRLPVFRGTAGRASGDEDVCQRPAIARHFRTRPARGIAASVICSESLPAAARGEAGRDDRASIFRGMRLILLYGFMIRAVVHCGKKVVWGQTLKDANSEACANVRAGLTPDFTCPEVNWTAGVRP